jgi:magnesium chelatase family protein
MGEGSMVAHVATVAFLGLEARAVEVQVQIASGLPKFLVVGLPDKAVGESRERVHAALAAIGLSLPPKRITVNLSPADLPKEGSHYDLPIALGLLAAMGAIDRETLAGYCAVGELGLDGRVASSPGVLLAAIHASARGLGLICPASQGPEAAWAGELEVVGAPDLIALLNHLRGSAVLLPPKPGEADPPGHGPDLAQVKGQETAKRALEIAAAGGHNLLMTGPPGAGKSLLAACLPAILPELTPSEALEVSMIASVAGELKDGRLVRTRPYRAPHHSASMPALVGGGLKVRPGEVSLAHLGVLFLDELPEFQRNVLDSLRQPLETGIVQVARANAHVTFPARVQLVAAMNPCDRVAFLLPGVPVRVIARKPEVTALELNTLGGKLKRRRRELGLLQKDVALCLGVGPDTLADWERDKAVPEVTHYPAIIAFLGSQPWPEPKTLGEKLRAERHRRGWSIAHSAARLGVDEGTFGSWERERRKPTGVSRSICAQFLREIC